jgi:hypothetical protein
MWKKILPPVLLGRIFAFLYTIFSPRSSKGGVPDSIDLSRVEHYRSPTEKYYFGRISSIMCQYWQLILPPILPFFVVVKASALVNCHDARTKHALCVSGRCHRCWYIVPGLTGAMLLQCMKYQVPVPSRYLVLRYVPGTSLVFIPGKKQARNNKVQYIENEIWI